MLVDGLGYVALAVPDVGAAVARYRSLFRFCPAESRDGVAYLTGDRRHHWLRLETGEPRLVRLGFQATDRGAIDRAEQRLKALGLPSERHAGTDKSGVTGGLRFTDPQGLEIELYEGMAEAAASPAEPETGFVCFLHAVVAVADIDAAEAFYSDELGFLRSDRIDDLVVFLRSGNRYHHSLAFAAAGAGGGPPRLDHVAVLVENIDNVMRFRAHGGATGALSGDVVRHAASGSISVYLRPAPDDLGVEFCTEHQRIDDDDYRGRLLTAGPTTVNLWSEGFGNVDTEPLETAFGAARMAPGAADGPRG